MHENRILSLLEQGDWGEDAPLIRGLKTYLKDRGIPRGSIFVTRSGRPLDLSRLADILGHTNVNTTRIYTRVSGGAAAPKGKKNTSYST